MVFLQTIISLDEAILSTQYWTLKRRRLDVDTTSNNVVLMFCVRWKYN